MINEAYYTQGQPKCKKNQWISNVFINLKLWKFKLIYKHINNGQNELKVTAPLYIKQGKNQQPDNQGKAVSWQICGIAYCKRTG